MDKKEKRKKFWLAIGLILAAAVLEILAFPPLNWYWLSFIFAVPLFFFLAEENRLWRLLGGFFIFRLVFGLGTAYFLIEPILFFSSILIFLGLPLSFYLIAKYSRRLALASLIILWPVFEFLEARYTALPNFIVEIGNALGSSPFLGLARWGGLAGLTVFCIGINLLLFFLVREILKKEDKNKKNIIILTSLVFVILFSGLVISKIFLKQNHREYEALAGSKRVALVTDDGRLDEIFKKKELDEKKLEIEIIKAGEMILKKLKELKTDSDFSLVILPEGLFDVIYDKTIDREAKDNFKIDNDGILIKAYRNMAINLEVDLVANVISRQDGRPYNTLLFFDSQGKLVDVFNKEKLTITGEYWPFGQWRPFYFNSLLDPKKNKEYYRDKENAVFNPANNLYRGESKIISLEDINLAPAICLEIHYPGLVKKRVEMGADMIINISSSIWINNGLEKYLALTDNLKKIEAVWLKKPILSTGRKENAVIITPDGKEAGILFDAFSSQNGVFIAEVRF